MVRFYGRFVRPGEVCFDIGAHTGSRTAAFLKIGARVLALEPNPAFGELIKRKFTGNQNFTLSAHAIGSKKGYGKFMISYRYPSISTLSPEWKDVMLDYQSSIKWEKEVMVNITTLDELIKTYGIPSFCKIDVEGYEEEALFGLSIPLDALSFEFFPTTPDRTFACIKRLALLGNYQFNWSLTESFKFISNIWLTEKQMINEVENYKGRKSGDIYAVLKHIKTY
jgi:FkbM family methyltransferase